MIIIPAIDIVNGACVRLVQGDFTQQKIYHINPVEVAKQFEAAGFTRLHVVDLDGAKAGMVKNIGVLENIAKATSLAIDYGGGLKTTEDVQAVFNAGAAYATIGSIAITNPDLLNIWIQHFGATKFLVGADVLHNKIKINGWLQQTAMDIFSFITSMCNLGIETIFCTDIAKDGLLQGPAFELYKEIIKANPALQLIASGGISSIEDVIELQAIGCAGAIIGKAIYEEKISLQQLQQF
jgi:phosphoribosylformimino-5-aminoimidazole carboxamide ribotide isomerase